MTDQVKMRMETLREQIGRLEERGEHNGIFSDLRSGLNDAELYLERVEDRVLVLLGLIRQNLDSYEAGESANPYGAWVHVIPFGRIKKGLQGGLPL